MKRKMFGAVTVGITAVALAMSAPATAQELDVVSVNCGPTVQDCVIGTATWVVTTVDETMDTVCGIVFRNCTSLLP